MLTRGDLQTWADDNINDINDMCPLMHGKMQLLNKAADALQ